MEAINLDETIHIINTTDKYSSIFTEKCISLAEAINGKSVTIHGVVEKLSTLLVDKSPEKREQGTLVLSNILENLPDDYLSSTELNYLSTFYADRLKDHHQVIPAVLQGIVALVQMKHLPEGGPHQLLNALFENVPCQQQQLKDRKNIYGIFQILLERRREEIQAMSLDFVLGVIQAIDGERDPRNLLLLFHWIPAFLNTVKLSHLTEEMFDVIACYFPVDFRAPSNDIQQSVTREDLSNALCPCLCAVPEFAEFCIPLLVEKLKSSLKIAKLDALKLLTESCKTFHVSIYEQHSNDIWDLLQRETLNSNDSEIEEAALNAIYAIIHHLSTSENHVSFLRQTVSNLYDSLKGNLRADTKLYLQSSKLLIAVARASKQSCNAIVQSIISLLLNQFNLTTKHKALLFETLVEFAITYIKRNDVDDIMEVKTLNEIAPLCFQNVQDGTSEMRVVSFESLGRIAKAVPFKVRALVYELLKNEIIFTAEPELLRNAILKCFRIYASIYPNEVLDHIILSVQVDVSNNDTILKLYLDALSTIITEKTFIQVILNQFLFHCTSRSTSKIAFRSLRNLLETNSNHVDIHSFLYENSIIPKLVALSLDSTDLELIKDVSVIMKIIIGHQSIENQQITIKTHLNDLLLSYRSNQSMIIILEGFLLKLRPEIEIEAKYQLIRNLIQVSDSMEESIYLYACQLIANLLNKSNEDENFINILTEIETYTVRSLENNKNSLNISNIIQLIAWITKSLIVKGSDKSELWTDKLISLLDEHEEAAKSFKLIMDDNHDCLSKNSYCQNRLLYRQKFFAFVCKKLSNHYTDATPNYLLALGYLLQLAPQQVIILYFKETLRLLIYCLELCTDDEVLCAVLNTLYSLIESKEKYLENHIDDLLPRFLHLTKFQPAMKVRIAALKCIEILPNAYPVYKLLPHKQTIIFGLIPSLDDKKRLVRRQAVETRSCWFLLDAPI